MTSEARTQSKKLPIRAPWRYRADGTYYSGPSNLNYNFDYYHANVAGKRINCEYCGANIAYTYKSKHHKRLYCQKARQAKQEQEQEQETTSNTENGDYSEFD